jgi:hypothetical protein
MQELSHAPWLQNNGMTREQYVEMLKLQDKAN